MSVTLPTNFNIAASVPLDARAIKADVTARDAIAPIQRYEGMVVFTVATGKNYQLIGGIIDANWTELVYGGGEPLLGNPGTNGYILSSTTAGVRSWIASPSSMVYPGVGISLSTGSAWGTSITDNSTTWNAAEPGLNNPGVTGYVLSSTTAGVRSWIAQTSALTPVSDILYWNSGSSKYTPYAAQATGTFDSGVVDPIHTTRLNYDGYLYATKVYAGGAEIVAGGSYTNANATPSALGGIAAGLTFSAQSLTQMFDALLYPYQVPTLYSFVITGQATTLESGLSITGSSRTFTWSSTNPGNINTNSLAVKDETAGSNIATGLANDGTESINIGSAISVVAAYGVQQWSITGTNSHSAAISKAYFNVYFYSPFYYGIGAAALSVSAIQALTKQVVGKSAKTYSFSPTAQKYYFAYPSAHGYLSTIIDVNGFNIIGSFTVTTKSFTVNSPNYEGNTMNYYVYEFNSLTTASATPITFNF